jgi:hypothetical protein
MFGCGTDPVKEDNFYKASVSDDSRSNGRSLSRRIWRCPTSKPGNASQLTSCWFLTPCRRLKYDFETLRQLSEVLPAQSPLANKARMIANNIMNAFDGTLDSVATCRELAEECLGEDWEARQVKTRGAKGADPNGQLWSLGHCHIDTAWLWPWSVTQQKVARSWSTQIDLMERYPEHQ